ncbi:MAG TPA: DNA sulfur modification protein DndB [Ilumatobacteraceae bacterium]|nr:DNA sulfur modification protein DndB [Ilumatobacteraceae bacterium]
MDDFEYVFPAIRGVQAQREYYVSQCPLRLIPRLFEFDDVDLPAEARAQRVLNRARLPEIAEYMVSNRDSYVFSALTASIDADVRFERLPGEGDGGRLGLLRIPMSARFVVNDGQHRRGAIELALENDPTLGDETIAVVFFLDRGLARCQQMFADLNRYAVRPSMSIGVLYDHRNPHASVARAVVSASWLLRDVVEMEKSNLSARSRKLFTLSAIFTATKALLAGIDEAQLVDYVPAATEFWDGIGEGFPEWHMVRERKLSAGEVRTDFIHSHGTVLHALGRVGNAILTTDPDTNWKDIGTRLAQIDWHKSNVALWEGRAMTGGGVSKSNNNVTLTTNALKAHLGLELSPEEQRVEDAFKRARRRR